MQSVTRQAACVAVVAALVAASAAAQPGRGIPIQPLPDGPITYTTSEGDIRVVVLARGLANPWSLVFLPDGSMLVTENGGQLRLIRDGELQSDPVPGVPAVRTGFLSGLFDIKLHPDFANNNLVYLTYSQPTDDDGAALAVARGVFNGRALIDVEDIFGLGNRCVARWQLTWLDNNRRRRTLRGADIFLIQGALLSEQRSYTKA